MYRKIVWCYVLILNLLDISVNSRLSAQGKSHGDMVHDSLIEGIAFQEWAGGVVEDASVSGGSGAAGALSLWPRALHFGAAGLGAPAAATVTLTNTANTTLHLASVAGTTPDFHASFFEAKTLPPQANTSFSVVYLGRREGPVAAQLYIHTSLGLYKYPVSAVGVASEWGVWPLVGVRVPHNASVQPLLTLYNPTEHTVQVSEVYSSGSWLGLQLPDGGGGAPRSAWSVPPRSSVPLVRLRLALPPHQPHHQPLTAYVRIKANMTGGGLVVCVEAQAAPPGEWAAPLQLRLRTRGSRDPPHTVQIEAGNSASVGVALEAGVWAARCSPAPYTPAHPHTHNGHTHTANGNGVKAEGVHVSLERPYLEPHQPLTRTAQLTLDYASMWAGYSERGGPAGAAGAWCAGWLLVGRAALPYSLRLLPGTLRIEPQQMHFVTANREELLSVRELRVQNEFPVPVHIAQIDFGPDVDKYFEVDSLLPLTVEGGASAAVGRVRVGGGGAGALPPLRTHLVLRTNLTEYTVPLLVYSGQFDIEWEWYGWRGGALQLGALGTSSTRHVRAQLHNRGVAPLCVGELRVTLPGAQLSAAEHSQRCVEPGGSAPLRLTVVAPARAGPQRGDVLVGAAWPPAQQPALVAPPLRVPVSLRAQPGRVHAHPFTLAKTAPYVWSSAPLTLESTMDLNMRLQAVTLPPDNPALSFRGAEEGVLRGGRLALGTLQYAAERRCAPRCYTGLDVRTAEGAAWLARSAAPLPSLREDAGLQAARYRRYLRERTTNLTVHAHTDHVLQVSVPGVVWWWWPVVGVSPGDAGLSPVGGAAPLRVRARNPSHTHALLLQPVVAGPDLQLAGRVESPLCRSEPCAVAPDAFSVAEWRAARGHVHAHAHEHALNHSGAPPLLLLAPLAEVEIKIWFTPREAAALTAYLYLRNNLTIMEGIQLSGRGAYPSFEIGGRRPGTTSPLLFEASECAGVSRALAVRNTGRVRVRLRDWRVAGAACGARGLRLAPCGALALQPNESRTLTLSFSPDWTLAQVHAQLELRADGARAAFPLAAVVAGPLLARCAAAAPRPPWEPALRAAGTLLALAALALVLAAAALDAERELRRARAARPAPPPAARQPLDLRAFADVPQQAPPPPAARRALGRRRRATRAAGDPAAERRAFDRWRRTLQHREDEEHSSEDNEHPATTTGPEHEPLVDNEERAHSDEDDASTGSTTPSASSGSPTAEHEESEHGAPAPPPRTPPSPGDKPRAASAGVPVEGAPRAPRPRRDPADLVRRSDRNKSFEGEGAARARPAAAKHHARKDKPCKRRPPTSPPRSPARPLEPRAAALRLGESWSSVVAARPPPPAPLAPIGSDVRRRAEPAPPPAPADHSLFYFNGEHAAPRDADFTWRPPAQIERHTFSPPRDFLDEGGPVGGGVYGVRGGVWAPPAAAAWLWGGLGELRPPPGFGAPPRPARPYDPFHSLASIWAPGARDWRSDSPPPPHDDHL